MLLTGDMQYMKAYLNKNYYVKQEMLFVGGQFSTTGLFCYKERIKLQEKNTCSYPPKPQSSCFLFLVLGLILLKIVFM